jgi:hypothetical protein
MLARHYRILILAALLLGTLAILDPGSFLDHVSKYTVGVDFIAYWASGRLLLESGNPYAPDRIFELQTSVGWMRHDPLVMFNPPWVLTFILPFSTPDYVTGKTLWMLACFASVFACSHWLWKLYGGTDDDRVWHLTLICTFSPILFMILRAQIAFILLVGIAGFLHFEKRKTDWIAGIFATLTLAKPHALFLFWVAVLLWTIHQKRWKMFTVLIPAALLISLVPLYFNPQVYDFFIQEILTKGYQYRWLTPTWGTFLRSALGKDQLWLQYLPTLLGLLWLAIHWTSNKDHWVWTDEMPWLILVSLVSNAYIWASDFSLCLVPLTQAALWIVNKRVRFRNSCTAITLFLLMNAAAWMIYLFVRNEFWQFWMMPLLIGLYALLERDARHGTRWT